MAEFISYSKALTRAYVMVNLPSMISMVVIFGLFYWLEEIDVVPKWGFLIGILIGIGMAWLVWSIQIPKWKIWAYQRVEDIVELKSQAIESKIIWSDDSIFTKTEIWNKKDKARIVQIEKERINLR